MDSSRYEPTCHEHNECGNRTNVALAVALALALALDTFPRPFHPPWSITTNLPEISLDIQFSLSAFLHVLFRNCAKYFGLLQRTIQLNPKMRTYTLDVGPRNARGTIRNFLFKQLSQKNPNVWNKITGLYRTCHADLKYPPTTRMLPLLLVFLSHSRQMPGYSPITSLSLFFPNPFKWIILQSPCYSMLCTFELITVTRRSI